MAERAYDLVRRIAARGGAVDLAEDDPRAEAPEVDRAVSEGLLIREAVGGDIGTITRLRLTAYGRECYGLSIGSGLRAWWKAWLAEVPFIDDGTPL